MDGDRTFLRSCEYGFDILVDVALGHMIVNHDGTITWDQLQALKTAYWGNDARAIEIYPATSAIVDSRNTRHLWLLGPNDYCPDLLGDGGAELSLQGRMALAWAEANNMPGESE